MATALPACGPGDATRSGRDGGAPAAEAGEGAATDAPSFPVGDLLVSDPVVAEPVIGERAALYLTLHNAGRMPDALTGVQAHGAGQASLHRTEMRGGVMRMRPVAAVDVPAGGTVRLRPGGLHGMLEGLEGTRWSAGDTVRLGLTFRRSGSVDVPAPIVPYGELGRRFPREDEGPEHESAGR